jgi:dipeptidyl aminopeptidase/acylaminoacyl peptidase
MVVACGGGNKPAAHAVPPAPPSPQAEPAPAPPAEPVPPPMAEGHPKDGLIPRSVLFGNPSKTALQISPDGAWYSWLAPKDGVLNVFVAPASDVTKARALTSEKTRPVRNYFWTLDKKHLLYQQDKAGDENFHVFAVDVTAATPTAVDLYPAEKARVEVAGVSWKKPGIVLIQTNDRKPELMDLYSIELATGKKTLLMQNDGFAGFATDGNFNVRFGIKPLPDGSQVWQRYDAAKKTWSDYDSVPMGDVLTTNMQTFDKADSGFYVTDTRDRDTGALFHVDAKTKKKTLVYQDAKADIGNVLFHPMDSTPEAVSVNYDKPHWVVLDKKLEKDFAAIAKLDDGDPQIVSATLDFQTWLVVFNSDHQSPHVWRWDRKKQKGEKLLSVFPELDTAGLAPMHPVVIKSRDGLPLVSYLTLPNDADANHDGKADHPVPTVFFIHGGPWARDDWGFNPIHQQLANRGYAVISVNYRGSTGFGKNFVNAGDKQWGLKMHDDVLDVVQWAIDQGIAPKDKIAILGGSYGGYETLLGISKTPDVFACGVDLVGPSDLISFQETIPAYWGPFIPQLHARVGDPATDDGKALLRAASPLTYAGQISRPLLIGQGKNDPRVNERESSQIVKAMQNKHIPVSYLLFPDEGHGFARPENNVAFFGITEAFLSVHLGGYYQPLTKEELAASSMQIMTGKQWLPGLPH